MGQRANNGGRKATLDDQKARSAGRQKDRGPAAEQIKDAVFENYAKGKTGGAFGEEGMANLPTGGNTHGAGGGGGSGSESGANHLNTGPDKSVD